MAKLAIPAALALALALGVACVQRIERKVGPTLETVDMRAPFLKVHMMNGDLYVLKQWTINESNRAVTGVGERMGPDRVPGATTTHTVAWEDVALYETNTVVSSPGVASMAVLTGLSVVASVACIANPKACFGSCPTFYAVSDDGEQVLQAEGFSDAIAPSLEKHDIDALWRTTGEGGRFTLRVTNEAYETHVIKAADVLAVPRPPGGRVLATDEALWLASAVSGAIACDAGGEPCTDLVRAVDGVERTSLTDGEDLAARETIDLTFPPATCDGAAGASGPMTGRSGVCAGASGEQAAVVIGARQSLVTTFLMYQGLAYLGTHAGTWLAELERGGVAARAGGRALQDLVGGIEVQIERDGAWTTAGTVYETGPLATDVHLVMLPPGETGARIRLRLPKGGWRIDHVALATITGPAAPIRIAPSSITGTLGKEFAADRVPATAFPIVTLPGDKYELVYELPAGAAYELFVDSRGYYLEWMRQQWLEEEQPLAALKMFVTPAQAMRDLAPAFKRLEADAEALFWSSRYAR